MLLVCARRGAIVDRFQYLDDLIIQPEVVRDTRDVEIQKIAGENFKKAFSRLNEIGLGSVDISILRMRETQLVSGSRLKTETAFPNGSKACRD